MTDDAPTSQTRADRDPTPFPVTAAALVLAFTATQIADASINTNHWANPILDHAEKPLSVAALAALTLPTWTLARRAGLTPWRFIAATNRIKAHPNGEPVLKQVGSRTTSCAVWGGLLFILLFMLAALVHLVFNLDLAIWTVIAGLAFGLIAAVAWSYLMHRAFNGPIYPLWPDLFNRCPACGYNLAGSPPAGPCPECARPYARLNPLTPAPTDTPSTT